MSDGRVVTFYSYKGGSGRSMTMANVAWVLATNGERVLCIDWDLEAPGLHRYFHPFLQDPDQSWSEGLIDRVWDYVQDISGDSPPPESNRFRMADCKNLIQELDLPQWNSGRSGGHLHMIGAGRQDDEYSRKVGGLDWREFYERFDGSRFLERLVGWARERYSYVLIDSRTGVADTAGICTAQLNDELVMCFVYNRQSMDGTAAVAKSVANSRAAMGKPRLSPIVVPSRVEDRADVDAARMYCSQRFASAFDRDARSILSSLRRDEVRHYPWCAFEEKLAIFEDVPGDRGSLLDTMHELVKRMSPKKPIKVASIHPEILRLVWSRAAFADPRLAELDALDDQPPEVAQLTLMRWIEEASQLDQIRPDWAMGLGEAAVKFASSSDDGIPFRLREEIAEQGLGLAKSAYHQDPSQYAVRMAFLLQARAAQYTRQRRFPEAEQALQEALRMFDGEGTPLSIWRSARVRERLAEVYANLGDFQLALDYQRQVVDILAKQDRRHGRFVADLQLPRALRNLAKLENRMGETVKALDHARSAVSLLEETSRTVLHRNPSEVISILLTSVELAVQRDPEATRKLARDALVAAERLLPEEHLSELKARLSILQTVLGRPEKDGPLDTLDRIDQSTGSSETHMAIAEARVQALRAMGRTKEAIDEILQGVSSGTLPVSVVTADWVAPAALEAGRQGELLSVLIQHLGTDGSFSEVLSHLVGRSSNDSKRGKT
jgi:tetratricopeptide (TPR) repeat protein